MLLSSTSPSSRSPSPGLSLSSSPPFSGAGVAPKRRVKGVPREHGSVRPISLSPTLSFLHSKFTSQLKVQGRMRGSLDQVKVGLNSTLEAVQFLSPRHPQPPVPSSSSTRPSYTTPCSSAAHLRTSGGSGPPRRTSDSVTVPSSLLAVNPNKRLGQRTSRAQAPESQLHPRFRHGCSLFWVHPRLRTEIPDSIPSIPTDTLPPGHLPDNFKRPQLTVSCTQLPLLASLFSSQTRLRIFQPRAVSVPDSRQLPAPPLDPWLHQSTSVLRPGLQD